MTVRRRVYAVLIVAFSLLAVSARVGAYTNDVAAGKALFAEMCAPCHGANAAGTKGVAPPIRWIANRFNDFLGLATTIQIRMPPPGGTLTMDQASNLAAYLWTLGGATPPPPGQADAQQVQPLPANAQVSEATPAPVPQPGYTPPISSSQSVSTPSEGQSSETQIGGALAAAAAGGIPSEARSVAGASGYQLLGSVATSPTGVPLGGEEALGLAFLGAGLLLQGFLWLKTHRKGSR